MDAMVLTDPEVFPSEEVIFSHLGDAASLWRDFFDLLHREYPELVEEWRFYRDGNSWLMKVSRKKKTIFWLSVIEGAFRITCYFVDRAEEAILSSGLSGGLKEQFKTGKHSGKLRGLTVIFTSDADIADAMAMISIKLAQK